jgi:hypothetical protein
VIDYLNSAVPYYEAVKRVATESPENLAAEEERLRALTKGSSNLVAQVWIPNAGRSRGREIETVTRLAMLRAAVGYKLQGLPGLNTVRDPFGSGPFELKQVERGFELRSQIESYRLKGSMTFVETEEP